jgi:hypothetical protein
MKKSIKTISIIVLIILSLFIIIKEAMGNGDFKVFLGAAKLLRNGDNIYSNWIFVSNGAYGLYYYSPLFALLLIPFNSMPNFIPNLIWLLLSVYFLYRIWQLIRIYFDLEKFDKPERNLLLILTFLFTVRFIHLNIAMIQMTIYLLWSIFESMHSFNSKQHLKGSVILALAINIKILPIVMIPYLIYRNKLKPVLFTIGFLFAFLLIPSLFIGFEFNNYLLSEWWKVINPLNNEHMIETGLKMHDLTALIPVILFKTSGEIELRRNIVNIDFKYVELILNSIRLLLILFTFYFLKTPPFKPAKSKIHELWELSYIILLIPLIFPHQQKYAFVLIFPTVAYVMYFLIFLYRFDQQEYKKSRWKTMRILLIIIFILTTITTDGIIGIPLNRITQHYKTITYGAILLLYVLTMCHPKYINKDITFANTG